MRAEEAPLAPPKDALAWLTGMVTALLHFAGALKSIPQIGALPIDFTVLIAALALPLLMLCAMTRGWVIAPEIGLPLAAIGALWLWLVLAGCWSASGAVLSAKLPEIILLGPVMLLAGLVVAGETGSPLTVKLTVLELTAVTVNSPLYSGCVQPATSTT